jgi:hypothetical protein
MTDTQQKDQQEHRELADVTAETRAMAAAHAAISKLDRNAQLRVIQWVGDRLAADWNLRRGERDPWEEPF